MICQLRMSGQTHYFQALKPSPPGAASTQRLSKRKGIFQENAWLSRQIPKVLLGWVKYYGDGLQREAKLSGNEDKQMNTRAPSFLVGDTAGKQQDVRGC